MVAQQQVQRRRAGAGLFQSLFSLCRSRAVVEQVVLGTHDNPILKNSKKNNNKSKVRTNTGAKTPSGVASDHGDHHSPYDTVSGSEDDDTRVEEVPLREGPASIIGAKQDQQNASPPRRTFHLPTREIVPTNNGGGMTEVSFLTIDPVLLTVSTEPSPPPYRYRHDRTKPSPTSATTSGSVGDDGRPRRDEYDDDKDDDDLSYDDRDDDDDISDITGFRDYSLISM